MRSLPHRCDKRSKLARLCRKWRGRLCRISEADFSKITWTSPNWFSAPFRSRPDLALHWKDRLIVYQGDVPWPGIIHEMGHVFAAKFDPNLCTEFDFFGWEFVIGRSLDLDEWLHGNADYMLTDGRSVGDSTEDQLERDLAGALDLAQSLCLVTQDEKPLSIR